MKEGNYSTYKWRPTTYKLEEGIEEGHPKIIITSFLKNCKPRGRWSHGQYERRSLYLPLRGTSRGGHWDPKAVSPLVTPSGTTGSRTPNLILGGLTSCVTPLDRARTRIPCLTHKSLTDCVTSGLMPLLLTSSCKRARDAFPTPRRRGTLQEIITKDIRMVGKGQKVCDVGFN